jgi:hypothetical protein
MRAIVSHIRLRPELQPPTWLTELKEGLTVNGAIELLSPLTIALDRIAEGREAQDQVLVDLAAAVPRCRWRLEVDVRRPLVTYVLMGDRLKSPLQIERTLVLKMPVHMTDGRRAVFVRWDTF